MKQSYRLPNLLLQTLRNVQHFGRLLPPRTTFQFLSYISYIRYNFVHFHKPQRPAWTRRDALLEQKVNEFTTLLRAAAAGEITTLQRDIEEACKRDLADAKSKS